LAPRLGSLCVVTFANFVVSGVKLPVPTFRSMRKPASLPELSVQLRLAVFPPLMVATRFDGAAGLGAPLTTASSELEYVECDGPLKARTRYV
jgi:hypothetical protein